MDQYVDFHAGSVGLAVLAQPVTSLLFPSTEGVAGKLMVLGVITVILNSTSNISNGVLQGIGRANIPMINAAVSLAVDVVFLAVLLFSPMRASMRGYCMIVYAIVMCVLNDRALKKYLGVSESLEICLSASAFSYHSHGSSGIRGVQGSAVFGKSSAPFQFAGIDSLHCAGCCRVFYCISLYCETIQTGTFVSAGRNKAGCAGSETEDHLRKINLQTEKSFRAT